MKTIFKSTKSKVYLILVLVSLVTVLTTAYLRMSAESQNDQVEIVLNYSQIIDLAKQSEEDEHWWLKKFSEMGATSVGLTERTLIDYLEVRFIQYEMTGTLQKEGSDFLDLSDEVKAYVDQADAFDLVIMPEDKEDFDTIINGLSRYESLDISTFDKDGYYVVINRDADHVIYENSNTLLAVDGRAGSTYKKIVGVDALELPIGFDDVLIREIDDLGMEVVLRPGNTRLFKDEAIDNYINEISKYDNVNPLLLLTGVDMLGYDEEETSYIKETYDLLEEKGMQLGLVESLSQSYNVDMVGLAPILDTFESDKFVRVFSLWPYIQQRYKYAGYEGGEEIGNSIYRAVIQRNIRVIYFNPFMSSTTDYVTDIDAYELVFDQMTNQLGDRGISIGSYTTMGVVGLPGALRLMLYVEVLLFGLVLLNEGLIRLSGKWNIIFGVLAVIGSVGAAYVVPNFSMKVFALLSAIVFSSLSGIIFYKYFFSRPGQKSSFLSGVLIMILTTMITMVGGLYVGSILMSGKFYLAIDNFMGVKFSLLIPVMVVVAYVALEYIKEKANNDHQNFLIEMKDEFFALLKHPIQVRHVLIVGVLGIVGYIYIARTGNVSAVKPMEIEIIFRNFLETTLVARPRNKELLLAFPSIILAIYYKKDIAKLQIELKYLARLGAMMLAIIGYTSITNTFSHIRTLIHISVARTLLAVVGSIVVALIFWLVIKLMVICYHFLANWIKKQIETMD